MLKAYKYRLYPTDAQCKQIDTNANACRFVYNLALEVKNMAYSQTRKNMSVFSLISQLPDLKKECLWLKKAHSQSLQQSVIDLDKAFTQFFKGHSSFPVFKNKKSTQSFRNPSGFSVRIKDGKLFQPKFKEGLPIVIDKMWSGIVRNTTITKTVTGKYFISVVCETGEATKPKPVVDAKTAIGLDLGLKDFIATSESEKVEAPQYLRKSLARLKVLQRRLRNKNKGSNNQRKAYKKVAVLHEKIANQRKDFLHKLSTKLIRENQTICLEDLNVKGMAKNRRLALSINDASWGEFVRQLKYKSDWYGINFLQIPRFEPSTKICSSCGMSKHDLKLSDRQWTCICGALHDRDVNAAINIKNYCIRNSGKDISGAPVELLTLVGTAKQEITLNAQSQTL